MTPTISVVASDEQDVHPIDRERYRHLAQHALWASALQGEIELGLLFVSEAEMSALNRQHMDEDGPTDVLSFPIDDQDTPGPGPRLLGDIVICPAVAARYAVEHQRSFDDELALLVVHGILHVLGMDHAHPAEEAAMQARQRDLLESWLPA